MATRVVVASVGDGWEVRANGLPLGRFQVKKEAIRVGREAAREYSPPARLDVQSKFTGTWRTEATY